jgi:hypothetical protein
MKDVNQRTKRGEKRGGNVKENGRKSRDKKEIMKG